MNTFWLPAIAVGLIVLFGLLWEYVRLYRREQERTHELEASIAERERIEKELEQRVQERTAKLGELNEALTAEIVERRKSEAGIRAERQRFNEVMETLPAYLVLLTPDYHVPFANRFFRERFGESNGRRCYEYLFGRTEPCEICETYTVQKTNRPHRWEWTGPDGRNYDIYDFPFTDTDGSRLIMEMGIDITERLQAESELERYREHLEELVKERTAQLEAANTHLLEEITERQRVEEQLKSERGNLQMIFNAVNMGMLLMREDGSARQVNDVVVQWTGKNSAEMHGFQPGDVLNCIHAVEAPGNCGHTPYCSACLIRNTFETVLRSGQPMHNVEAEATLLLNGKQAKYWLELSVDPLVIGGKKHAILALNDITARKQAEETLRQNEALLQAVLDNIPEAIYLKDRDSRLLLANPATLAVIGKPAAAVLGKTDAEFYDDPATGRAIMENDRRIMNSGQMEVIEESVADPAGTRVYLSTKVPYRDADGRIIGLIGVAHDITERKRAEVELVRLASFPERNPNPIVELEYSGDIVYLNPKARELFPDIASSGLEHHILAGLEHLIPKFIEGELEKHIIQEVKAGDAFYHQTIVNIPESGRIRLYNVDITARKQAEEALLAASLEKQASQYARTLIEVSLDPMVTISPEGKITDVNAATVKATGVPREELIGTNFSGYFTEPEKAEQGYRQVFAEGYATDYPLTIRRRDGHVMDVFYNASLYKDATGNILGAFAAARDVTARKQAEAELKRHKDNLEILVKERTSELEESSRELARSNENLEQFAYVASHDLQEPLRIMSSYSQLLEKRYKDMLDQDANEFIDFIVDAAARMQKLITDLLAYSRAGRGTTDMVEVDCNRVVRRLVAGLADTIESADGHVTFDRLPVITAHESSLIQLFQNLIGNALKFRGEQPPCIHVSARQANSEWVFSVRDNGIGIEPQYSQRIFMIFQRLHPRDKYPGTGIGLSICKKIVENLGGRIWVESEPGQGSTFYFTVPISKG